MTSIRKLIFIITAIAMTAFALPSFAAQPPAKQYGLDITSAAPPPYPGTGGGGVVQLPAGGGTVYWTISNQTSSGGNSAVGSFVIKKAPGVKISSPAGPPGTVFDLATLAATGDLRVSNVGPLVPKQDGGTHQVTINFTLTPEDPCAGTTTIWAPTYVVVTTGTFSQTTFTFTLSNGPPQLGTNQTTSIAAATTCYKVTGVASPSAGGTVACNPSSVPAGADSVCTATANLGYFPTGFSGAPIACVQIGSTNQCKVSMPTVNPQDTTTTGGFSQSDGKVGCVSGTVANPGPIDNYDSSLGNQDFTYDPDKSNVPFDDGWGLRRGNNKDDGPCVLVNYAFTPAATGNGFVASLLFDQTSGQKATWKYLIVWPNAVLVDSSNPNKGWTTFRPSVSYGIVNPTPQTTDFVPGLFCVDDVADVDITTLSGAQLAARLPVIPNDCPSGPFCTSPHAQYQPGITAKVCIVRHGVTTGPLNTLFPFTEVLDEADSYLHQ